MKKKKRIIIGIIILVIVGMITIFSLKITSQIKEKNEIREQDKKEIQENYDDLNKLANEFNKQQELFDELYQNTFLDSLKEQTETYQTVLKEYHKIVIEMTTIGDKVKEKCQNDYQDSNITKNCNSINKTKESAESVYVKDKQRYNELIEKYNNRNPLEILNFFELEKGENDEAN